MGKEVTDYINMQARMANEKPQRSSDSAALAGYEANAQSRQRIDRDWCEYPIGTKAHAVTGGHWEKTARGWKWHGGSTFPRPGGDAVSVTLPAS